MSDYSYTPLYYGTPCQVKWYDVESGQYVGGIGFHEWLIKGNGDIDKLDDIVWKATETGMKFEDAVVELEWVDISEAIY